MTNDNGSHPIIAHGELYVEPITKKGGPIDKAIPHEYQEAKQRIISDIDNIFSSFRKSTEVFLKEKIICVRMEPKFEAKSYVPSSVFPSGSGMDIVGGRRYSLTDEHGQPQMAKLYFVKTDAKDLASLRQTLEQGIKDTVDNWRNQIGSIHSLDLLKPMEKVMGFPDDWKGGTVEIVLHPLADEFDDLIILFFETTQIARGQAKIRSYEDGLTFISARCSASDIEQMKNLNPLRAIHPLGRINIEPIRTLTNTDVPIAAPSRRKSSITVGVFDGGANETIPLLRGYVKAVNCVPAPQSPFYISHGTAVSGAVLYGNLAGKGQHDRLPPPSVSVESFRVLPLQDENDFELYEAIDAVENIVKNRPDIKLFNLSFGPIGAIIDDSISRFTYVLDRLTYDVPDDEINPLFCVAVGNDGNLANPLNRIQSPSDMVNGLGVGAYTYKIDGKKARASYSCVGTGREGAKIKPDLLDFGGSVDRPFVLVGSQNNSLVTATGTSFAAPFVAHKIGKMMAQSGNISPHIARTLLIHNAETNGDFTQLEQGYGFCIEDVSEVLTCENKKVTILYSGTLRPSQTVRMPIFAPRINTANGLVTITWTVTTIVDPYVNDPDAYTNNCIEDVFVPHDMTFNFTKKGASSVKLNLLKEEDVETARRLIDEGYIRSGIPASHPAKKCWNEKDLRAFDFKWDTVIKKHQRMKGASLLNPVLTLHAIGRNDFDALQLKYYAAISIEAPKYVGSLYDAVLQNYQNLVPIEIRNINRIMVNM